MFFFLSFFITFAAAISKFCVTWTLVSRRANIPAFCADRLNNENGSQNELLRINTRCNVQVAMMLHIWSWLKYISHALWNMKILCFDVTNMIVIPSRQTRSLIELLHMHTIVAKLYVVDLIALSCMCSRILDRTFYLFFFHTLIVVQKNWCHNTVSLPLVSRQHNWIWTSVLPQLTDSVRLLKS